MDVNAAAFVPGPSARIILAASPFGYIGLAGVGSITVQRTPAPATALASS